MAAGNGALRAETVTKTREAGQSTLLLYGATPVPQAMVFDMCRQAMPRRLGAGRGEARVQRLRVGDAQPHEFEFAWFGSALVQDLAGIARHAGEVYAEVLGGTLPDLRRWFADATGARMVWPAGDDVDYLLAAGLIADLGICDAFVRSGLIPIQPAEYWVWAFEGGTRARNTYGVHCWKARRGSALYRIWHADTKRRVPFGVSRNAVDVLADVLEAEERGADHLFRSQGPVALELLFSGFLVKQNGRLEPGIPALGASAVQAATASVLAELFSRAAAPAMNEAITAFGADVNAPSEQAILRHGFARLLLEHSMDVLIERGVLPPFPREADSTWAAWMM
ncbi:MAG: hypothetical protein WBC51_21140 [Vicinamibacterales bacterium]|jgi:hypothetical protein